MHPKYPVIASIIAAITFVSAFTYHLAGFFLGQTYKEDATPWTDDDKKHWNDAKEKFQIYFRFVDDGNTELVMNGAFGIFVLLFLVPYRPNLMIFAQDFFGDFWKPVPPLGFKVIKKSSNFLVPAMPG